MLRQSFEKLKREVNTLRAGLEQIFKSKPARCPIHHVPLAPDLKESLARSSQDKLQPVWKPCPKCELERHLTRAGVPTAHLDKLEEHWDTNTPDGPNLKLAKNALHDGAILIVLHGPPGNGKTHVATALLASKLPGISARWLTHQTLLEQVRRWYGDHDVHPCTMLNRHRMIVLDDAGRTTAGVDAWQALEVLLDLRLQHGRPMILTTNLTPDRLGKQFSAGMCDRLGTATWIEFRGSSRREYYERDIIP